MSRVETHIAFAYKEATLRNTLTYSASCWKRPIASLAGRRDDDVEHGHAPDVLGRHAGCKLRQPARRLARR